MNLDLKELSKKFPNDREFGSKIRTMIDSDDKLYELSIKNPNDEDFGKNLRKGLVD